jgi:two-component system, probable response regulator PhcQ
MPRILLVDDEPNVLSSLRRTIHAMPTGTFESEPIVETFDMPEMALQRASECAFDLVVSDWRMPGMSGIVFLNELIQLQPTIARLVLSGYGDFLKEVKAVARIKIFHFINKPWDNAELRLLLQQALEHRRLLMINQRPSVKELRQEARLSQMEIRLIDRNLPSAIRIQRESFDAMSFGSVS